MAADLEEILEVRGDPAVEVAAAAEVAHRAAQETNQLPLIHRLLDFINLEIPAAQHQTAHRILVRAEAEQAAQAEMLPAEHKRLAVQAVPAGSLVVRYFMQEEVEVEEVSLHPLEAAMAE